MPTDPPSGAPTGPKRGNCCLNEVDFNAFSRLRGRIWSRPVYLCLRYRSLNSLWSTENSFKIPSKDTREMYSLIQRQWHQLVPEGSGTNHTMAFNLDIINHLKGAERYLKRVEFQLSKEYVTMAYAYVLSPGKEKNTALNNVRSGYKECSDLMCSIENELEQMMGTLTLQMKGFARLCPGDVFEICIKHGPQKWKNRGRVMKNSEQTWDNEQTTFKVLLPDVLVIKAVEVKGLGKNSMLGNKFCDTADLFSAHPQIMTVNLNSSGSLKLNLIVTWNEDYHPATHSSNSIRSSPRSTRTYGGHSPVSPSHDGEFMSNPFLSRIQKSINSIQSPDRDSGNHELSSNSSNDAYSCQSSTVTDGPTNVGEERAHKLTLQISSDQVDLAPIKTKSKLNGSTVPSSIRDSLNQQNNFYRSGSPVSCSGLSGDTSSSLRGSGSQLDIVTIPVTGINSLQETINSVIGYLEDLQGQYPELQGFETTVLELDDCLRKTKQKSHRGSISSNISISVESALECFDFLDTEDDSENFSTERLSPDDISLEKLVDSKFNENTADQGFASFTSQNSEKSRHNNLHDINLSSQHTINSYEQVELALITHLLSCQTLIEEKYVPTLHSVVRSELIVHRKYKGEKYQVAGEFVSMRILLREICKIQAVSDRQGRQTLDRDCSSD
ncbi:Rho family-interacting cell polarization regulator 2 [Nymphon striatum]|nr:Rho family-interacting cell polarization regulator 2 [Nymphon striatum]